MSINVSGKAQDYLCTCYSSCLDCPAGAIKDNVVVCAFSCVADAIDEYLREVKQNG